MQLKMCPVCGNRPAPYFDGKKHIIECEYCKTNGFTVRVEDTDLIKAIKTWNYRELFNRMLVDCDYFTNVLKQYSGYKYTELEEINLEKDERFKFYNNMFFNTRGATRGCLIDKKGNIIKCYQSHISIVLDYLGLSDTIDQNSNEVHDLVKKSVNQGLFVRVTICGRHLAVEVNSKSSNKTQIDSLIDYITSNKNDDLKDIINWGLYNQYDKSNLMFYDYNEFLNAILFL